MSVPVTNFDHLEAYALIRRKFSTYKAFAEKSGISANTLTRICSKNSRTGFPSEATIRRMAVALEVPYSQLLVGPGAYTFESSMLSESAESAIHARDFIEGVANLAKSRFFNVQIEYQVNQSTPKMILDFVSYGINQFGLVPKELKITERECEENE